MTLGTPLLPLVQVRDVRTGLVVGRTTHLQLPYEWTVCTNEVGTLSVQLHVAEPGDAAPGTPALAAVLLGAVGGATGAGVCVPLVLELSLDGGQEWDARLLVQTVTQTSARTMTISGPQLGAIYAKRYIDEAMYGQVPLVAALAGAAGTLPITLKDSNGAPVYGVIGASGTFPYEAGILRAAPGPAAWAGVDLLRLVPVLDPSVAFQKVTEQSLADTTLKALDLMSQRLASDVDVTRGTWVAESCSAGLSLARRMAGIVAPTTGTAPTPTRERPGASSAALGGVDRAVVVGHVGRTPFLTFADDTTGMGQEDTGPAPLLTAQVTHAPDTSTQVCEVSLEGGTTRAGLPAGGKITRVTCLHRTRAAWPHPAWVQANLPLVAVYGGERTGGLYTTFEDGRFHPCGPANVGISDVAVDDHRGMVYLATDDGVYRHSTDVLAASEPWVRVGTLVGKVRRLQVVVLNVAPAGQPVSQESYVWAHVSGSGKEHDGLYRHDTTRGQLDLTNPLTGDRVTDTSSGIGSDQWSRMAPSDAVVDFCATDHHSIYYFDTHDLTVLHYYDFWPVPGGTNQPPMTSQTTDIPLLGGATGTRLDRVITVATEGHQAQDSVWIGTKDDAYGLQVLSAGGGGGLRYGNADHSLESTLDGQPLVVQRCVGLGLVIDHTYAAVVACTNGGLYYSSSLDGTGWTLASGESGLAGYAVLDMAAGQTQQVGNRPDVQRLYVASEADLFVSNSGGVWYKTLGEGSKVDLSTYFVDLARLLLGGAYPDNDLQSIGPGPDVRTSRGRLIHKSSDGHVLDPPLSGALAWQRRLSGTGRWFTWLVDTASASVHQYMDSATDIQADSLVDDTRAAQALATLAVRELQETNLPQTTLTLRSRFTEQEALLRRLKPTMRVASTFVGEVTMVDNSGAPLSTVWVDLRGMTLYVTKVTVRGTAPGACLVDVEVSTTLRTRRLTLSDWAAGIMHRVKALAVQRLV